MIARFVGMNNPAEKGRHTMNVLQSSRKFTETETAKIEKYLDAFRANFFDPYFYKTENRTILIFPDGDIKPEDFSSNYIQACTNADYCSGFLYGAVVQHNRHLETIKPKMTVYRVQQKYFDNGKVEAHMTELELTEKPENTYKEGKRFDEYNDYFTDKAEAEECYKNALNA